jgi:CheY-like chemotaxis protein
MNELTPDRNRRILVIDDNRLIHDDFRKILSPNPSPGTALTAIEEELFARRTSPPRRIRYDIDSAYQGQDGVTLVKKAREMGRPYAMAFVDVRMPPGQDGLETTQRLLEIDPDLQIVICTAYADYSWDELFERIGDRDGLLILKKPFDTVEVFQLAHALTEKWWLLQQSRRRVEELESRVAERTSQLQQANQRLQAEVEQHTRTEQELRWMTAFLQAQVHSSVDGILVVDQNKKVALQNQRFIDLFNVPPEIAEDGGDEKRLHWITDKVKNPEAFLQRVHHLYAHPNETGHDELELKDGTIVDRHTFPAVGKDGKYYGRVWSFRDITERKRVEARLFQVQKLETVGRLAGGVAHAFNSILTAIIGQTELILSDLPPGSPLAKNAAEIHEAAGRAAKLTQQLLAYGRKQVLQPGILNLNRFLANIAGSLKSLMGPHVEVRIIPADGLKPVRMDPGQMEQVIVNIARNAAAVMPNGGKLTLETGNVTLDEQYARQFPGLKPGQYVMLAITDTGPGISPEVKKRLFEPFFPAQGASPGPGLGLATCDGILKQSGGHINVYSEPSLGATFKIYLPQLESTAQGPAAPLDVDRLPHGTESLLLVEDDPALREMAATLLTRLGYAVMQAADGLEALKLKQQQNVEHFDLVLTDVVMPHMGGKELSERVRAVFPQAKILFTSAYTENVMVQQGLLPPGAVLLQKPFTPTALARKVREVLDDGGTR